MSETKLEKAIQDVDILINALHDSDSNQEKILNDFHKKYAYHSSNEGLMNLIFTHYVDSKTLAQLILEEISED